MFLSVKNLIQFDSRIIQYINKLENCVSKKYLLVYRFSQNCISSYRFLCQYVFLTHVVPGQSVVMCEKGEKFVKSVSMFVKIQEVVRDNHRFSDVSLEPVTHFLLSKILQRCHMKKQCLLCFF